MRTNTTLVAGAVALLTVALVVIEPRPATAPAAPQTTFDPVQIDAWYKDVRSRALADTVSAAQSVDILKKAIADMYWRDTLPVNGKLYVLLGYALKRAGCYYAAATWYEAGMAVHARYGGVSADPSASLYKPAANIYTRLGDNPKAERLLRTAIDSSRTAANLVENRYELGLVYANMQRDSLAFRSQQTALLLLDSIGADPALVEELYPADAAFWRCIVLQALAQNAHAVTGESALNYARQAMDQARRVHTGRDDAFASAQATLGQVYARAGRYPDARRCFQRALAALPDREQTLKRERAKIRLELAQVERASGRHAAALSHCQEAVADVLPGYRWQTPADQPALADFYPENVLLDAQLLKGQIFWDAFRADGRRETLQQAMHSLELACAAADTLRAGQQYEEARLLAMTIEYPATELLIAGYHALQTTFGDPDAAAHAFALAERRKAVALVGKRAFEIELARLDPQANRQYRELLETLKQTMTNAKLHPGDRTLADRLGRVQEDIYRVEVAFREKFPQAAVRSGQSGTLAAVQTRLAAEPGAALLEYFYSPTYGRLYGWSITPDGVQFRQLPYPEALLKSFAHSLDSGAASVDAYIAQSRAVYDSVVAPLLPPGAVDRLVVVPDGLLNAISFEALLDRAPARADYAELPYLLWRYRLRTSPSAGLAFRAAASPSSEAPYATSYLGVAPFYGGYRGWLDTVKYSLTCIGAVQEHFGRPTVLAGPAATVEAFKAAAADYDVVQFYGHAGTSSHDRQSRMAFTCTNATPAAIAGNAPVHTAGLLDFGALPADYAASVLTEDELLTLRLRARLVMLSACETGAGDVLPGEGVMSLGRGFLYAGAASTVLSLWKLNDKSTCAITRGFFDALAQGACKDDALCQAKQQFLETMRTEGGESRRMTAPHYWAAMVVMGDNAPVLSGKRSWWEQLADRIARI